MKESRVKLLKKLREYGVKNEVPNITDVNATFIRDIIKIKQSKNMLEIGTANGFSSICFADQLDNNGGKLTTIEFSANSQAQALENFKEAGLDNIISYLGNALDIIPELSETYDFVFIDGMKRRSVDFLQLVWDKVESEGVIIIDDVIKFREKMVGLREYLDEKNILFNVLPIDEDDGIMLIIK